MAISSRRLAGTAAAIALGVGGWALFEAQWLETRVLEVPIPGLAPELDGLSILHLSDFHAGSPSLNARALRKAVDFGVRERPDLVAITGDLVTHPRGERMVVDELARLRPPLGMYAVLGNHDLGEAKDPFSRGHLIMQWGDAPVRLLRDELAVAELNGRRIEVAGMDPASWYAGSARPEGLFSGEPAFRVLLAHFPEVFDRLPDGACALVLAGHLHGGQITLSVPGVGAFRSPHEDWRYAAGRFTRDGITLVVSRGTGTTLVPFRLMSRPEAALLRLVA